MIAPTPAPIRSRTDDLIDRLTSRKFILCLTVIALAVLGFFTNHLTYDKLTDIVIWAVGIFSGAEGIADAAAALRPTPSIKVDTMVVPPTGDVTL